MQLQIKDEEDNSIKQPVKMESKIDAPIFEGTGLLVGADDNQKVAVANPETLKKLISTLDTLSTACREALVGKIFASLPREHRRVLLSDAQKCLIEQKQNIPLVCSPPSGTTSNRLTLKKVLESDRRQLLIDKKEIENFQKH